MPARLHQRDLRRSFDDVLVPDEALLGEPGQGWQILKERLVLERIMISSGFLGSVGQVLDMTVEYANEREQFGKTISSYQGVTLPLAEMFVRRNATGPLRGAAVGGVLRRGPAVRDGKHDGQVPVRPDLHAEASALAVQLQGAYGYVRDHTLPMRTTRTGSSPGWWPCRALLSCS